MAGLAVTSPSSKKAPGLPGLRPGGIGGFGSNLGGTPAPAAPKIPQNPTTMNTYGGSTQQTDQMGRVITTTPGSYDMFGKQTGMGSTTIEDPDQIRRARDLADFRERQLDPYGNYIGPKATGGGGGGGGTGGGGGDGGGGLDINDIKGLINEFRTPVPAREPNPSAPPRIEAPTPAALPSAKSMGFARAKDTAGRLGNQALAALRSQMVERGIEGSGLEGALTSNVLGDVARGTADAAFEQERAAEDQAWEAAKLGYQGNIGQRGQDLGLDTDILGAGVSQRGQDIGANSQILNLMPSILSLVGRRRY